MEEIIQELYINMRFAELNIKFTLQDIEKQLLDFYNRYLKNLKGKSLETFENDAFNTLCKLKSEVDYFISIQPKNLRKQMIHARDLIFLSKLKNISNNDFRRTITKTFNSFVQGITYFQNQHVYNMNDPIYHRDGSCSPKNTSNVNCQIDTKLKNNKNTRLIETCYIERLIYDCLWTDLTQTQQDMGHIDWLTNTRNAYHTCLPAHEIQIKIHYKSSQPIQLEITKYNQGKIKTFQTYRKSLFDDSVACKMETKGKVYAKVTSFLSDVPWTKI